MNLRLRDQKENLVYLAIWLLLFLSPLLSFYVRALSGSAGRLNWVEIIHVWKVYAVYLAIFLVHNFFLAPLLVDRHRKLLYLATTSCLLAVFVVFQCMNRPALAGPAHGKHGEGFPPRHELREGPPGPRPSGLPGEEPAQARPPHRQEPHLGGRPPADLHPPLVLGQGDVVAAICAFLLVGMNLGVKLYFKSDRDAAALASLERENLEQQLEYLKYQINPHFFMNTLNNIHALVDIEPEKAKSTIVEQSKMMRYVLYEGNKPLIPLQREVQFLGNYITIMGLRYTDKVKIGVSIPEPVPNLQIPPLLLITFVENAFKHGVSYQHDSFIDVEMRFIGDRFYFGCRNSRFQGTPDEQGGVGLANVRKRLDLIYGDRYTLETGPKGQTYEVRLDLPLAPLPETGSSSSSSETSNLEI